MTLCSYQTFLKPQANSIHIGCQHMNLEFNEENIVSNHDYIFAYRMEEYSKSAVIL
jgi:hypothetical protein